MKTSTIAPVAIVAAGLLVAGGMTLGLRVGRQRPPREPIRDVRRPVERPADDQNRSSSPDRIPPGEDTGPGRGPGFTWPPGWGPNSPITPFPGGAAGAGAPGPAGAGAPGADGPTAQRRGPAGGGAGRFGQPGVRPGQQGTRAPDGASGGRGAPIPMDPASSPWAASGAEWAGPRQRSPEGAAPAAWPGGAFGRPTGSGGAFAAGALPRPSAPVDPAYEVLNQLQRELGLLASAVEDLENASIAIREKNQDQVREILHRGAQKLAKVTEAFRALTDGPGRGRSAGAGGILPRSPWGQAGGPTAAYGATGPWQRGAGWAPAPGAFWQRGPDGPPTFLQPEGAAGEWADQFAQGPAYTDWGPWGGPAGGSSREAETDPLAPDVFVPIAVPVEEPTAPGARERLEEHTRSQFRLLHRPYMRLREDGVEMPEVEELLRSGREALNAGALRSAALSINAAAELMGQLLATAEGAPPAVRPPDNPAPGSASPEAPAPARRT